jgi:hypothetical protein
MTVSYDLVRTGQAAAFTIHGKNFVTGKHELFLCLSHSSHRQTDYLHKIQIILKTVK